MGLINFISNLLGGDYSPSNPEEKKAYFWNRYNTPLKPEQEDQYYQWLGQQSLKQGRDLQSPDYDMRGYWLNLQGGGQGQSENLHFPDTFKKPNHMTFSNQSQYSNPIQQGGIWNQSSNNQWTFQPSNYNLQQHQLPEMANYFQQNEPGNILLLPKKVLKKQSLAGKIVGLLQYGR